VGGALGVSVGVNVGVGVGVRVVDMMMQVSFVLCVCLRGCECV